MKKKILAITLCIAMLAIAIVGGTMAYFTDEESDVNVMTTGNLEIVQVEQQRDENGALEDFENDKILIPAVIYDKDGNLATSTWVNPGADAYDMICPDPENTDPDHLDFGMPNPDRVKNAVDKVITVRNDGDIDAWVRTIVLFEDNAQMDMYNNLMASKPDVVTTEWLSDTVTINGQTYCAVTYYYPEYLKAGESTVPSLIAVWLNPLHNGEVPTGHNGTYEILSLSQATQYAGFETVTAKVALNEAFGEVNKGTIEQWFAEIAPAAPQQ